MDFKGASKLFTELWGQESIKETVRAGIPAEPAVARVRYMHEHLSLVHSGDPEMYNKLSRAAILLIEGVCCGQPVPATPSPVKQQPSQQGGGRYVPPSRRREAAAPTGETMPDKYETPNKDNRTRNTWKPDLEAQRGQRGRSNVDRW